MKLGEQLLTVLLRAPLAPLRMRARSLGWLVVYLGLAAAILGVVAKLILAYRQDLLDALLRYVLPGDWLFAGKLLIERFFDAQAREVVANAAIGASLLVVQVTLFPVKEALSSALEREASLCREPIAEHPLWFQAWEELKLVLLFLAVQGTVFWIGYSPDPVRAKLALIISYAYLFASLSIDFVAPILQRHKLRYSSIVKALLARPALLFGFGAVFAAPPIWASWMTVRHPEWSLGAVLATQFGAAVVAIAWAALGGTVAGARLIDDARGRPRSAPITRVIAWSLLVALLTWNGLRFGAVASSLHHKSQILKCSYAVDWTSIDFERPSLGGLAAGLMDDDVSVRVSLEVTIRNPTSVDVEIEENHVAITQRDQLVAKTALPRLSVPAGQTRTTRFEFPLSVAPSQLLRLRELLTTKDWAITLWLRVAPGFDFPIYLLART